MKKIILNFESKSKYFKELVQEAFNKDILHFLVSKDTYPEFKKIERLTLYSKDIELPVSHLIFSNKDKLEEKLIDGVFFEKNIGFYMELRSKDDERRIVELSKTGQVAFIIVSAKDWKIIPFENLIAEMHLNDTSLIAAIGSVKEAELMLKVLEIGVDGILLEPKNANEINNLKKLIHSEFNIEITTAKILKIQNIRESERVCVDTTSLLHPGEGLLVGSTAMGFVLVHAEVFETEFVGSRPFRVNAGDVSAYVLVPGEEVNSYRTKYLSELKGGDNIIVADNKGNARIASVGRVKIETRPMIRFELEALKNDKKIPINIICQNAETIRLVGVNGKAKSVVDIEVGDNVLVHLGPGSTHFGTPIKETIIEK